LVLYYVCVLLATLAAMKYQNIKVREEIHGKASAYCVKNGLVLGDFTGKAIVEKMAAGTSIPGEKQSEITKEQAKELFDKWLTGELSSYTSTSDLNGQIYINGMRVVDKETKVIKQEKEHK
jgi:hypothetical protein